MSTERSRDRDRFAAMALLIGVFLLGMALRLYDLDGDSLWYDEIFTSVMAQLDLSSAVAIIASGGGGTNANQVPLAYAVTHFFILLLGDSDLMVRLQATLFGCLSILLAYKLGEILWTRKEGLIGAFLLAVNAYHVGYSQEARHYALMVFLALLCLIFLLKALETKNRAVGLWIGFVLCTGLSLYNHYFAFLFLPAVVIFGTAVVVEDWLSHRRLRDSPLGLRPRSALSPPPRLAVMFYGSMALVGVTYVPWLPALQLAISTQLGQQVGSLSPASLHASLSFLDNLLTEYTGAEGATSLLWMGLFLLGLAQSGRKRALLALSWVGIPLVFPLLVTTRQEFNARYTIFVIPVFLLTVGRGVVFGARWLGGRVRAAEADRKRLSLLVVTLASLGFGVLSVGPLRGYYLRQKQDYRGAARYLRDNMASGDLILADSLNPHRGGAKQAALSLGYYLDSYGIPEAPVLSVQRGLWAGVREGGYDTGQVWVALFYPRPVLATETVQVIDFYHVALVRLAQPSGDVLEDTESVLQVLPGLLRRPGACFDVYLALAEVYVQMGRLEEAASQLHQASLVQPDDPAAAREVVDLRSQLAQRSHLADSDIEYPLWRNLGDVAALLGHSTNQQRVERGEALGLSIWWQALAGMDRDYSLFIHLIGEGERIWAHQDELLQGDGFPTSAWQPGKVVRQEYWLVLPLDMPPGEYVIKTGVYYWETGERLPVWDEHQNRVWGDVVVLQSLVVE